MLSVLIIVPTIQQRYTNYLNYITYICPEWYLTGGGERAGKILPSLAFAIPSPHLLGTASEGFTFHHFSNSFHNKYHPEYV